MDGRRDNDFGCGGLIDEHRYAASVERGDADDVAADDVRCDSVPAWCARVIHLNKA